MSTVNSTESIYISFKFSKTFFSNYNDSSNFACKMAIKPFGNVFRMNLDSIAKVVIKTRNDRVMVEMCCTKDVQKYHSFQFEEVVIKVAQTN